MVAVNNAGFVLGMERVGTIADTDIESMFATNVLGLISMSQLLVKGDPRTSCLLQSTWPTVVLSRLQGPQYWTCH